MAEIITIAIIIILVPLAIQHERRERGDSLFNERIRRMR